MTCSGIFIPAGRHHTSVTPVIFFKSNTSFPHEKVENKLGERPAVYTLALLSLHHQFLFRILSRQIQDNFRA